MATQSEELSRPTPDPNRVLAAAAVFVLVLLAGLTWAKWWPYGHKLVVLIGTHTWSGSSPLLSGADGQVWSWSGGWRFTVSYGQSVWMALVVGLLVAAGVEVLLPRARMVAALNHRRGWTATAAGAGLSLPCMMCTCCASPVTTSLRRQGVPPGAVTAFWLGNPVLNPAVIAFLALALPWKYAALRVVIGIVLVFGASALASVVRGRERIDAADMMLPDATRAVAVPVAYLRALGRLLLVLVPEYFVVVFLVGALHGWLVAALSGPSALVAVLIAAVVGTLMVIPTSGELPVIAALAAAGVAPGVPAALLIALPAVSLPSMVMVGRALSWSRTLVVAGCVVVAALLSAAVATLLG
ncbi:MAG TPA: permease [Pseudonocardiaceae bacterium]|nr:permease [Pseudonocardiaceae bacterium]